MSDSLQAPPPPPPPLLQPTAKPTSTSLMLSLKISPLIQKLQEALDGYWFEPQDRPEPIDTLAHPVGPYFFYGTLMDPPLLSEILSLSERPRLRPAKLIGYSLKLWGQYPALVDGPTGAVVEGMVYNVEDVKQAERLAEYETRAYHPSPCRIHFSDGSEPEEAVGSTFKYGGNPMDISEGKFDLGTWLGRMGRVDKGKEWL